MSLTADYGFRFQRLILGRPAVRRTQLYCVSLAKSGTHSICSMFSPNVAARHEPQATKVIEMFFDWHERRIHDAELRNWIRTRDRELALEVDSSWFNGLILDFLASEFPRARFLLTIRDCYSWANSEFRRVLHRPSQESIRVKLREFLYARTSAPHSPEEQVLKETGLYPLAGYLARWTAHNEKVLATIPSERLLVVRTDQIRPRAFEVAEFAGLQRHTVRLDRTHEYRNPVQRQIITEIDPDFLEQKIKQHCRPLMRRFFPEIKTLADAKL
jgi:hypothetical protein